MGEGARIRCFDYVNHPYERVRDALTAGAREVFRSATRAAASRADSLAAELRVQVAGFDMGKEIAISVDTVEELAPEVTAPPLLRLELEWEAASAPRLFPFMRAELLAYPLTDTETQLELCGRYEPPLGPLGGALNAVALHRIAEASVHRFLNDVAGHLRASLTARAR
jgi:hypothetical protein